VQREHDVTSFRTPMKRDARHENHAGHLMKI